MINGAPMSYWAGNDGENPMRYAGGMLGGVWPALLASDLGAGKFDGAYLVENFEYLNPANTYFDKYYNLFSKIDTEPERFLEFERWWGGFFLMDRQEIKWIVENLFVGNNLADGDAEWSEGRAFDLRAIKSPIILFASLGDNITPPQQAFNWVADLYPTTEALKANGQVIVGLMHKSVGHLGIFVSGQVAKREHAQIVDLIEYIEHLPPGLYGMQVEEQKTNGSVRYDVMLTERRVEDLQVLQKYGRKDEMPFQAVEADLRGARFRLRNLRAPGRCGDGHARCARSQRGPCIRNGRSAGRCRISTPSSGRSRAWPTWPGRTARRATTRARWRRWSAARPPSPPPLGISTATCATRRWRTRSSGPMARRASACARRGRSARRERSVDVQERRRSSRRRCRISRRATGRRPLSARRSC